MLGSVIRNNVCLALFAVCVCGAGRGGVLVLKACTYQANRVA